MAEQNISVSTIARLFKEVSFQDEKTRIATKTLELSAEYIRLFTREAILRSNEERLREDSLLKVDGIDNVAKQRKIESKHEGIEATVADTIMQMEAEDEDEVPTTDLSSDIDIPDDYATQKGNAYNDNVDLDNDVLDARHLGKIAGILILDF